MFGGRFSLTKFSLHSDSKMEISVVVNFVDSLKNLSGFGSLIIVEESWFDSLKNSAKVTPTLPIEMSAKDGLKVNANIIGGVIINFIAEDDLNNRTFLSEDIHIVFDKSDELKNNSYVGKNIGFSQSFEDELKSIIEAAKNILTEGIFTDILHSVISSVILENDTVIINVTIPAGSVLEIHSDTYDVFLDGVNILDKQKGDWVFLDRNVKYIEVDTGTGGELEGRMLYNERYL